MGARIIFSTANNKKVFCENYVNDYPNFREWTFNDWKKSEMQDQVKFTLGQEIEIEAIEYMKITKK